MDEAITQQCDLTRLLDAQAEWLIVRENGTSFPLQAGEIEVSSARGLIRLGFVDDRGFHSFPIHGWSENGDELAIRIGRDFGKTPEIIRLVPRTSAAALAMHVEIARTERAGEIGSAIARAYPHLKLFRVALSTDNGRLVEIIFENTSGGRIGVLSDVTESLTAECMLVSGMRWIDRLRVRSKKPYRELWLAGPKKQARPLQKLCGLLRSSEQNGLSILLLDLNKDDACRELKMLKPSDLWREKPKKLLLPGSVTITETAKNVIAVASENIDVINSKQGETIRFHGLPFVRVRTMLGREKAWLGFDRSRRPITEDNRGELSDLIRSLEDYRRADGPNRRHRLYSHSPEAWLESILRRNIKLLDPNLILAPIYNQFRASSDKIDLLALRRDRRLVIIELKTSPDREMVFQSADYWRKIEMQRRRGNLAKAKVFGDLEILDVPALVYAVAPALSFHRDFEYFARKLAPEIELWRFELHENWRRKIKVIGRKNYNFHS
ncbi:MAG: hypothetical protein ACR2IH_07135 [Pyrinomonadaceae bacterium]